MKKLKLMKARKIKMGRKAGGKNAVKQSIEPIETSDGSETGDSEFDALGLNSGIGNTEPKRGRKSKEVAQAEKDLQESLDAITHPKILGDVVFSLADARLAQTGSKIFEVSEETRIRVGTHARTCIKAFKLIDDPKYYALGLLIFEFGKITIQQEMMWRAYQKSLKSKPVSEEKKV